jgi:uncharacterized Fe-S cluster-containing radical SAM superfamily protein
MINPYELTQKVKKIICQDTQRKYYRFRATKFYGGCATADCLGCNLRCAYCWAQKKVWNPKIYGNFYNPTEVSEKLLQFHQPLVRISGGEPTICRNHLIEVINLIPKHILFILETNGILLDEDYIKQLSNFGNLYIRVSLKGVDQKSFEKITGAKGIFFEKQLGTLRLLNKYHINNRAAILADLFTEKEIQKLNIPHLEYEALINYPFVSKALKKRGISIPNK